MKWAKLTFVGVTSPLGGLPAGNYISGPMPDSSRPFSLPYSASGFPYTPGYYPKNTFPSDLTTDKPSLQYYQVLYAPVNEAGGGSLVRLFGGYFDKTTGLYEAGWTVFEGSSPLEGAVTFSNSVPGSTGTVLVEINDDATGGIETGGKSPLIGSDFVWGFDGFCWRWIYPSETTLHPDLLAAGGGRYHQNVIAVSHGNIYYGSLT
jgi:hypothetical protein